MKISELKKTLGNFTLSITDMRFEAGKVHGLIGANGSGKTTLSKLIMGIYPPDEGEIDYEGIQPGEYTMITQRPYLLHGTVYQNLVYPLRLRGIPVDEAVADEWLGRCGLLGKRKQYARSLSSGERQKLSFARAMIFSPRLVIIDESFSNLDPDSVKMFDELIKEQQKKNPLTWIIISHQLVHISRICDQVHFMENGRNLISGTVGEVLLSPTNDAVCRYLEATEISFKGRS